MTSSARVIAATALVLTFASAVSAQHSAMPAGMTHEQHMAQMKKDAEMKQHGNVAMGFDQDKTTHHRVTEHKTGDPITPPGSTAAAAAHGHQQAATHNPSGTPTDHFGRHFDNAADWVQTFDDPARDAWQMPARVIDALQLARGQVVADVGAGTGYFSTRLAKSAATPKVYAVDIEPSMVAHLTERAKAEGLANMTAVLAGADRTNLPEPVDVVLVVDTYHHIPNRVAYFTALKASLKPGGRLAIVDFRKDAPQGPPVEFRFTPDQISAELAQAGFRLQASHDFLPQQVFLVYGVR